MIKRKYDKNELVNYFEVDFKTNIYKNKNILLHLDSICLGDTICFSCFVEPFLEYYNPKKLIVSTFFPHIFESRNNIEFIKANQNKTIVVDKLINVGYNQNKLNHTLGGMFYAAKQTLCLPQDTKPKKTLFKKIKKEVQQNKITIGPESIKKIARWDYKGSLGWQTVVNYLANKNFIIYNVSYEKTYNLNNVYHLNGLNNLDVALTHISQSRIFIGLSSGLSWLSWAYDIPVVMISNFTKKENEFECFRVENKNVCNGCFNLITEIKSTCPFYKNTDKENECHNKITPNMVIEKINEALNF